MYSTYLYISTNTAKPEHLLFCIVNSAFTGRTISIPTIIIGKMEMELPAMYIMKRFIGTCKSNWIQLC